MNATPETPRQRVHYSGNTQERLKEAFLDHPEADSKELAMYARCPKFFAVEFRELVRIAELGEKMRRLVLPADVEWIAKETLRYLSRLQELVDEAKDVDNASDYARWVQFSGIIGLVQRINYGRGVELLDKCKKLIQACGDRYRSGNNNPSPESMRMTTVDEKLNALTTAVAALTAKAA
jgi:hypothetical protein